MFKLIKNMHSAAIHLPPAKNMPEVTLAPGVTPIASARWDAATGNAMVQRWCKSGVLVPLDMDRAAETGEATPAESRTAGGGELAAPAPLPPLPTKGGKGK